MLKLRKIAITGGLGSGKTTVCKLLKEQGAYIVSGDAIAHHLLKIHQTCIKQAFGTIDRTQLANIVFEDQEQLRKLEAILHPPLLEEIANQYRQAQKGTYSMFACELPILFEKEWETEFDLVVAIFVPDEVAKQRYVASGHTSQEYEKRMQYQLSPEEKARRADVVINNTGSLLDVKKAVKDFTNGPRQ